MQVSSPGCRQVQSSMPGRQLCQRGVWETCATEQERASPITHTSPEAVLSGLRQAHSNMHNITA